MCNNSANINGKRSHDICTIVADLRFSFLTCAHAKINISFWWNIELRQKSNEYKKNEIFVVVWNSLNAFEWWQFESKLWIEKQANEMNSATRKRTKWMKENSKLFARLPRLCAFYWSERKKNKILKSVKRSIFFNSQRNFRCHAIHLCQQSNLSSFLFSLFGFCPFFCESIAQRRNVFKFIVEFFWLNRVLWHIPENLNHLKVNIQGDTANKFTIIYSGKPFWRHK